MGAITLRDATERDAAVLGRLHVAAWHETYAGLLPDEVLAGLSVETRCAMWREILGNAAMMADTAVVLAEDGEPIGFGSCGRQRDEHLADAGLTGEIGAIYLLRAHQRRGAGRSLMAVLSRALVDRGHRGASLWVLRENGAARRFYEALGGEQVGERTEERPGATLVELAYGWRDLSGLAG